MKKIILAAAFFAIVSCKKESSNESFGTGTATEAPTETTTEVTPEATAEVMTPEALGKSIVEGKGNCYTCHQVDKKVIGPSIKEIAQIYKDKNANMVTFLLGKGEPIVDPSQYEVMKTNFPVTKAMTDAELAGIEAYFQSTLK
ncbi:c-type cytochrome [Flavobacterium sp. TMP13]|uniref:c-type cytochrome n=1 Tax=unclassified Flavobacterium TaxID=196869 RepID=UPI000836F7EC|nr:c-type cytochrome [Flavobacterium sp. TAB 87]